MKKRMILITILILTLLPSVEKTTVTPISESISTTVQQISRNNFCPANQTRIMSYNLLADSAGFDGTEAFTRADGVCKLINSLKPDALGLQEVSRNWYYCLRTSTRYKAVNPISDAITGTMTTIFYNPDTLTLLNNGEKAFSSTFQSRLRRIVWGVFCRKEDGARFCLVNTHLSLSNEDWTSSINQAFELVQEINRLSEEYGIPVFITGDFNSGNRSSSASPTASVYEAVCTVADDTQYLSQALSYGDGKSIQAVYIDHIFLRGDATITKYEILSQKDFAFFSDHYPIFVDFCL